MAGRLVDSNSTLAETLGYSGVELGTMVFTDFTHPDDDALRGAETILLVMTDVAMPELSGPEMRVLYVSGYTDRALAQRELFLQKPFSVEVLTRTMREVPDAPDGNNERGEG